MRLFRLLIGGVLIYLMSVDARANIVLGGTRLIYPGGEREITLPLSNKGATPALVQSWIDDGATGATPENSKVPFLIMPPITRIEGQASQTLRILYNGTALPEDRESLFWLNVLEVPPVTPESKDKNNLLVAIQSRIKVFYRPAKLTTPLHEAAKQLQWQLFNERGKWMLRTHNASGLYISFARVYVARSGKVLSNKDGIYMVAPRAAQTFDLQVDSAAVPLIKDGEVKFDYINDYGALKTVSALAH